MTDEKLVEINKLKDKIELQHKRLDNVKHMRSSISWNGTVLNNICIQGRSECGNVYQTIVYPIDCEFMQSFLLLAEAFELIELDKLEKEYKAI